MAGSVIVRGETEVDCNGYIIHDDRVIGWDEADFRAGRRLDRRKAWAFIDNRPHELVRWTQACSGCSCDCGDGYPCDHGASGCDECGYHGVVRNQMWIPTHQPEDQPHERP